MPHCLASAKNDSKTVIFHQIKFKSFPAPIVVSPSGTIDCGHGRIFSRTVMNSGLFGKLKQGAQVVYIFLMAQSDARSSREITATDSEIATKMGIGLSTVSRGRQKLIEYGLVVCKLGAGCKYTYTICDPETGKPYPGNPKVPIRYNNTEPEQPEAKAEAKKKMVSPLKREYCSQHRWPLDSDGTSALAKNNPVLLVRTNPPNNPADHS